jgi:hypothetical protein
MALTEAEVKFVARLQAQVDGMNHSVRAAAQSLLVRKKAVTDLMAEEAALFGSSFGDTDSVDTAAAALQVDLDRVDVAVDELFNTGLISGSRVEMEGGLNPSIPQ